MRQEQANQVPYCSQQRAPGPRPAHDLLRKIAARLDWSACPTAASPTARGEYWAHCPCLGYPLPEDRPILPRPEELAEQAENVLQTPRNSVQPCNRSADRGDAPGAVQPPEPPEWWAPGAGADGGAPPPEPWQLSFLEEADDLWGPDTC